MVQIIMAITLYVLPSDVASNYRLCSTFQYGTELQGNKRSKRPKKICLNTTRLTNVARFGIHRIFKLGLLAKSIFFFYMTRRK